jgi:hypothetical protein
MVRIRMVKCLLGFGLFCLSHFANAQFIGFEVLSRSGNTTFSFEKVNNLVIIPVVLNDRLPLNFILDTGVRTTILTDRSISDLVNISYDRQVTLAGAGQIREINAFLASDVALSMPGIKGQGQSLVVLEEDYLELRSHLGMNVHGIIGYEFFNHFVVRIDYDRKLITVYDPEVFRAGRRFTAIPFSLEQGRPFIEAGITQFDGSFIDVKLLIDSGASHGILLETDSENNIILPENILQTIIGWGLGGELSGHLGRIRKLALDEFSFKDMIVSFIQDFSTQDVSSVSGRNGSLGGELLNRFTVIFDYGSQMLYLRKNRNYSYPFEFNLSGIDLVASGSDYSTFKIINIIEGSPADVAGVKEGDLILALNGKFSTDLTLSEINNQLRSQPGNKISLMLNRDSDIKRISFRLKRMI